MSYSPASDDEVASCALCGDVMTTVLMGLGALAALAFFALVLTFLARRLPVKIVRRFKYFNSTFTPKNKLKVCAQLQPRP